MSQNTLWKYTANIALIEFLQICEQICFTSHQNNNDNNKKYWIIIRHILKHLEHHVINNTDSVTTITFQIQHRYEILTWDLTEQFLMTSIKAARYTFIKQNGIRRHNHLNQLCNNFFFNINNTLIN